MGEVFTKGQKVRLKCVFGVNPTTLRAPVAAGATTISVRSVSGLGATDQLVLAPGTLNEETVTISSISGTVITLTAGTTYSHGINTEVWELADPTTVTLSVKDPADTVTSYTYAAAEVTRESLGRFYRDISLNQEGTYQWWWVGTGTVETADDGQFYVSDSVFSL